MRVGPAFVVMLAIASCRGPRGTDPNPPQSAVVESAGAREPVPEEPAPPSVAPSEAEAPPPPPPPQVVTTIETPFSPTALVVRRTDDASPVVLFEDEGAAIRARVGRFLAARGHELVPVAELERIEAAAAQGRLVLEGDQQCQAPLTVEEAHARYFPRRPFASVSTDCFDDCRLTVMVEDPANPDAFASYTSRIVTRPHDPRAWASAAEHLRSSDSLGTIGLGMFGIGGHVPPIRFQSPAGIGPWKHGQPASEVFDAIEPLAAGCAHPDPLVGLTFVLRASVDRKGHVLRCAASSQSSLARPSDGECLCRSIETIAFGPAGAGRRLRVEAVDDGVFRSQGRLELVQPGTEPWVKRLDASPALLRCLTAHPMPSTFTAQVLLSLAPDGAIDDLRIKGDITTLATMSFASCVVQELRRVPLPCRPPGVDTLQLRLAMNG